MQGYSANFSEFCSANNQSRYNFTLKFTLYKISDHGMNFILLSFSEKKLYEWNFEYILFWVKNPILVSNITLLFALLHWALCSKRYSFINFHSLSYWQNKVLVSLNVMIRAFKLIYPFYNNNLALKTVSFALKLSNLKKIRIFWHFCNNFVTMLMAWQL